MKWSFAVSVSPKKACLEARPPNKPLLKLLFLIVLCKKQGGKEPMVHFFDFIMQIVIVLIFRLLYFDDFFMMGDVFSC